MTKLIDIIQFNGTCGRLEFFISQMLSIGYCCAVYVLNQSDFKVSIYLFFPHLAFGAFVFILFFSSIYRRAKDAKYSANALIIYFILPVILALFPVFANLMALPFGFRDPNLAEGVRDALIFLSKPLIFVVGLFSFAFHFSLFYESEARFLHE